MTAIQTFKVNDSVKYSGDNYTVDATIKSIEEGANYPLIELDNGHSFRWDSKGYYSYDLGVYLTN